MQRPNLLTAILLAASIASSPIAPTAIAVPSVGESVGGPEANVETPELDRQPDIPLSRGRVERVLASIAVLVNRSLNAGDSDPDRSVEELVSYYDSIAQVAYYYTNPAPNRLQCLTREQYRQMLLNLARSFPDPLQSYRYDYRIDRIEIGPEGRQADVTGTIFETLTINGRVVWQLEQAWAVALVARGDRVLVQQEVSAETDNLQLVPRCPRPDFLSDDILDRAF